MPFGFDTKLPVVAALGLACLAAGSLAADTRPPAGQMCPDGAYVIGFDSGGNIVCSAVAGTATSKASRTTQDITGEAAPACPESCSKVSEQNVAEAGDSGTAATHAADGQAAGEAGIGPVISKIKPSGVVFGARETTIRIIGSGFTAGAVVKFQGVAYTPAINAAGTELQVTIVTRDLPMGRYAITISNDDGSETTRRNALEVF